MNRIKTTIIFCLMCLPLLADVIVLKNGKQMIIHGSYEVKGPYVVFTTERNETMQLPAKVVDLEKSKLATAEYHAKMEAAEQARLKAEQEALRPKKEGLTMAEIAEIVQKNRAPDAPMKENIEINTEQVGQFADDNPRPTQSEAAFSGPRGDTTANNQVYNQKAGEFSNAMAQLEEKETRLRQRVASLRSNIEAYDSTAFADGPTNLYEQGEKARKDLAAAEKELADLESQKRDLDKQARQAGVKNYRRVAPAKQSDEGN